MSEKDEDEEEVHFLEFEIGVFYCLDNWSFRKDGDWGKKARFYILSRSTDHEQRTVPPLSISLRS